MQQRLDIQGAFMLSCCMKTHGYITTERAHAAHLHAEPGVKAQRVVVGEQVRRAQQRAPRRLVPPVIVTRARQVPQRARVCAV